MRKTQNTREKFARLSKAAPLNVPASAGQLATPKVVFGDGSRYAVAAVFTRFAAVSWFVWDAEQVDPVTDGPAVVRQTETLTEAVLGLVSLRDVP